MSKPPNWYTQDEVEVNAAYWYYSPGESRSVHLVYKTPENVWRALVDLEDHALDVTRLSGDFYGPIRPPFPGPPCKHQDLEITEYTTAGYFDCKKCGGKEILTTPEFMTRLLKLEKDLQEALAIIKQEGKPNA